MAFGGFSSKHRVAKARLSRRICVPLDAAGAEDRETGRSVAIRECASEGGAMDDDDEEFAKLLKHLIDHPEERTAEFDRFVRELLLDPRLHQSLVDRIKRDELEPEILNQLLAYARDPNPTPGRTSARKVLSEGWRDDDVIH
jgi:hypothetical protein